MHPVTSHNPLSSDFICITSYRIKKIKKVNTIEFSTIRNVIAFFTIAADYSAPLGNLQSFENEWVEIEMRPSKGWCEPTSSTTVSTVSTIPSCDTIDESNVPSFLRDDIDLTESMDDRNWTGNTKNIQYMIYVSSPSYYITNIYKKKDKS